MIQFARQPAAAPSDPLRPSDRPLACNVVTVIKVNSKGREGKEQLQRKGLAASVASSAAAGKDEVGSVRAKKRREENFFLLQ